MSRKPVKNDLRALDDLPMFSDPADALETEVYDASPKTEDDGEFGALDDALQSLDETDAPATAPMQRQREQLAAAPQPAPVHWLWSALGVGLCVLGMLLGMAAAARPAGLEPLLDAVARLGLSPTLLLGVGLATWGIGVLLARQHRQGEVLARVTGELQELLSVADAVDATTRALQEADAERTSTGSSSDEIGQVLFALQRHEEKLINLTKATKTFGKPLVEMTTQLADVAAQIAQGQTTVQALRVAIEGGMGRVEEALHQQPASDPAEALVELKRTLERVRAELHDDLQVALRELTQIGTDSLGKQVAALSNDLGGKLAASGREVCASMAKELKSGLAELGKTNKPAAPDLTPIERALADVRREITNLGQGVAQAAAAARTAAPAPATPAPKAAPTEKTDKSEKTSAAKATTTEKAASEEPPASGLAHSIAGERTSKGGNVLGAIAKLKKMRS